MTKKTALLLFYFYFILEQKYLTEIYVFCFNKVMEVFVSDLGKGKQVVQ